MLTINLKEPIIFPFLWLNLNLEKQTSRGIKLLFEKWRTKGVVAEVNEFASLWDSAYKTRIADQVRHILKQKFNQLIDNASIFYILPIQFFRS
jgi:hypothetical protein